MTNKSTLKEKIDKIIEYCEYSKDIAHSSGCTMSFRIEIENSREEVISQYSAHYATVEKLSHMLNLAIRKAQEDSKIWGSLVSVKVWIKTFNSECELIDEEPIDDYEINFERGVEI